MVVAWLDAADVACFIALKNEKAGCGVGLLLLACGISGTPKAFLTPGTLRAENYQMSINKSRTVKD